jgi:hypothetical protein
MKIECSLIRFRIDIDFPECDVDVAIAENWKKSQISPFAGEFKHKIISKSRTPTSDSVMFCLQYLMGCTRKISQRKWEITNTIRPLQEFEALKVNVKSILGLCQGNCHLEFEVYAELFTDELVTKVTSIVSKIFKKHVKYYKTNK